MKRKSIWLSLSLISMYGLPFMAAQQRREAAQTKTVPRLVRFSGTVRDAGGNPLSGVVGINFSLYKEEHGGGPLWHEIQNVQLDANGYYTALLGASAPEGLPAEMFTANEARWLGVEPVGQAEQPRVLLLSVPYALKAADAETLGGRPASAFMAAAPQSEASMAAIAKSGARPEDASTKGTDAPLANVGGSGTTNFIPIWKSSTTLGNSVLFQTGTGSGAKVGLNTTTPGAPLDVEANNATFAAIIKNGGAGSGLSASGLSNGVVGQTLATTGAVVGVLGKNSSTSLGAAGVRGEIDATTSAGFGVLGITSGSGTLGAGVVGQSSNGLTYGVEGITLSSSNFAAGVNAVANELTGQTYGLEATNESQTDGAISVFGRENGTTGKTFGAFFSAVSGHGTGTYAQASGESGTAFGILGCCPVGVWGDSASNAPGAAGLVGTADDGRGLLAQNNSLSGVPSAFAFNTETTKANLPVFVAAGNVGGIFRSCTMDTNGNLGCTGAKSAVVPVDNGQRHVALYAVEAPQNWFEDFGSGRLAGGAAIISLDRTFAQTVDTATEYHVFLTPESDCRGLYVSKKTAAGFEVHELSGGQSNVPFAYRIVALRRGYQNVRLEDMTERMNNIKASQPKAAPGSPLMLPAPRVRAANSGDSTATLAGAVRTK